MTERQITPSLAHEIERATIAAVRLAEVRLALSALVNHGDETVVLLAPEGEP